MIFEGVDRYVCLCSSRMYGSKGEGCGYCYQMIISEKWVSRDIYGYCMAGCLSNQTSFPFIKCLEIAYLNLIILEFTISTVKRIFKLNRPN